MSNGAVAHAVRLPHLLCGVRRSHQVCVAVQKGAPATSAKSMDAPDE